MKIHVQKFLVLIACATTTPAIAQNQTQLEESKSAKALRPLTRLIWQNESDHSIRWADMTRDKSGFVVNPQVVSGFPKLDEAKQSLV